MNGWLKGFTNQDLTVFSILFITFIVVVAGLAAYEWTPRRRIRRLDKRNRVEVKWTNLIGEETTTDLNSAKIK